MFKAYLLKKVISFFTSSKLWEDAIDVVRALADEEMSGEEKRELAVNELKELGGNIATFLINLLVEAAYTYLRVAGMLDDAEESQEVEK